MKQGMNRVIDEYMMPNMPMRGGSVKKKGNKKGSKSGKRGC